MKVTFRDMEVRERVESGDAIITKEGHVRIVLKDGFNYCTYSPTTNDICIKGNSIESILEKYNIKKIIKSYNLELREI